MQLVPQKWQVFHTTQVTLPAQINNHCTAQLTTVSCSYCTCKLNNTRVHLTTTARVSTRSTTTTQHRQSTQLCNCVFEHASMYVCMYVCAPTNNRSPYYHAITRYYMKSTSNTWDTLPARSSAVVRPLII